MMGYSVSRGVGASPVVDYVGFMLDSTVGEFGEFCTSSCLREIRFGGGPQTRRPCFE